MIASSSGPCVNLEMFNGCRTRPSIRALGALKEPEKLLRFIQRWLSSCDSDSAMHALKVHSESLMPPPNTHTHTAQRVAHTCQLQLKILGRNHLFQSTFCQFSMV